MDDIKYLDYLEEKYQDKNFIKQYEDTWYPRKYPLIYRVNQLPIHFDPNAKKILLSLSGGADSTMLLFMLCTLIQREKLKTKIDVFTMIRFWDKKPWLTKSAEDVYNYLKKRFPKIIGRHHWGFLPPVLENVPLKNLKIPLDTLPKIAKCDVLVTREYQCYLLEAYNYEYVYSGTTMNPPIETKNPPKFRDREIIEDNFNWVIDGNGINPFGLLRKNYTMAQYVNYQLDDLLKLTRSCEGDILEFGEEYKYNKKCPPECGHCFFCVEKQWGKDNAQGFLYKVSKKTLWRKLFG